MYFNAPNTYLTEDKRFIIENGMTLRQVVEKLHAEKIIENPETFLYLSQVIKGIDPKVRYGEYFFEKNISYYKILHKMVRGYICFRKITIAEGLSTKSAIDIIDHSPGLIGKIPENISEGSLLPETYFYSYNDSKSAIVRRMQSSMQKSIDELWETRDMSIPVKTKEEALTLASIVEREAGSPEEMPNVASVFTNRLRKNMKLQSDPTIIYSFTFGDKNLERPIRLSDIRNNSKYNTYHIYGLPPAPIANPGLASLKAVLNPPQTDYLYFVASGYGDHMFSTNIKDHNKYVAKYRSLIKSRTAAQVNKDQKKEDEPEEKSINKSVTIQP